MKVMGFVKKGIVTVVMAASIVSLGAGSEVGTTAKAAEKETVLHPVLDPERSEMQMIDLTPETTEKVLGGDMKIAATSTTEKDEYYSETATYVESTMDAQMSATINGTAGPKAEILTNDDGIRRMNTMGAHIERDLGFPNASWVVFTLDASKVKMGYEDLAYYCWDAIANKENLCTLSIYGTGMATKGNTVTVFMPSSIEAGEHIKYINEYKSFLAYMEKKVDNATSMTDLEILTYYYDALGQATQYATKECAKDNYNCDVTIHMPVSLVKREDIVCQGYAVILNQLLRHSGIVSYNLFGKADGGYGWGGHAWNAVKINGKWYYADITWDDYDVDQNKKINRSRVTHDYLLFDMCDRGRKLEPFYQKRLSRITSKSGDEFDDMFLKNYSTIFGFHFIQGAFYTAFDGMVYRVNLNTGDLEEILTIPYCERRFIGSVGDEFIFGGYDGIYNYDPTTGAVTKKLDGYFSQGYVRKNKFICYEYHEKKWETFEDAAGNSVVPPSGETGTVTPGTEPGKDGTGNTDTVTPSEADNGIGIPGLKVKAVRGKKLKITINGKNDGTEFMVSDSTDFTSGDTRDFSSEKVKSTWVISGLSKNRTYYVRVRGFAKQEGQKNFSGWSSVKKVTVKR